ncbi:MAG: hypothetical protein K2J00_07780 [Bacteroidaceae bacterium]|nr:hypothetical protein [Bacteroidaceae bacterium]
MNNTAKHWYEENPERLYLEKLMMSRLFPGFQLRTTKWGKLEWFGMLDSLYNPGGTHYSVVVEYHDGGLENFGNPGIIVTPVSPDFKTLFPDQDPFTVVVMPALLNDVARDMQCIDYEDPLYGEYTTIPTAASVLIRAMEKLYRYEDAKHRAEAERHRHALRTKLSMNQTGCSLPKVPNIRFQ